MTPTDLLEAENLSIGYAMKGGTRIVSERIGFRLQGREFVCLLGPNGAGKSTLLRTLAGIQAPLAGTVRICGTDSRDLDAAGRAKRLGLVLTERVEGADLTVRDLVALGRAPYTGWLGRLSDEDGEKIAWALAAAGCVGHASRKVSELSDGERQKAMIARVLAQETPIVILDEPTAHLDLPNRIGMMRLLKRLARETGKSILLSTHELDLALQSADQVWLLGPGGRLEAGAPEDLVLAGAFGACFGKSGFHFDIATGAFRVQEPGRETVHLGGTGPAAYWTRRALEREGFRVGEDFDACRRVRIAEEAPGTYRWLCETGGRATAHGSLASLLAALRPTLPD
jgi:iron complex transport system ATP-binding protein